MKNFKKSVVLLMIVVICLCSITAVHAGTQQQEKIVGMFTALAKQVMELRQFEGEKPNSDYDSMIQTIVLDNNMEGTAKNVTIQIINDAYYNYDKMRSPMDKKKVINRFTMLWYHKLCAFTGMDPE